MRARLSAGVAVLLALGVSCAEPDPPAEIGPGLGPQAPAIAILSIPGSNTPTVLRPARAGPDLEVAVWPDGRIIWAARGASEDRHLLEARIGPKLVTALIEELRSRRVFLDAVFSEVHYGPDSDYTLIQIVAGAERVELRSWHERFESNPNLVVTEHGVGALQGESREAAMQRSSPDYRRFRAVWSHIRSTLASWIPATGAPVLGPTGLEGAR